jgi:hypothetical protein
VSSNNNKKKGQSRGAIPRYLVGFPPKGKRGVDFFCGPLLSRVPQSSEGSSPMSLNISKKYMKSRGDSAVSLWNSCQKESAGSIFFVDHFHANVLQSGMHEVLQTLTSVIDKSESRGDSAVSWWISRQNESAGSIFFVDHCWQLSFSAKHPSPPKTALCHIVVKRGVDFICGPLFLERLSTCPLRVAMLFRKSTQFSWCQTEWKSENILSGVRIAPLSCCEKGEQIKRTWAESQ